MPLTAPPEPMVGRAPEGQAVGAAMGHVKKSDVQITSNGDVIWDIVLNGI